MNTKLDQSLLITPSLVFFVIASTQFGLGVLRFTKDIAEVAGYQSWIAVIITGLIYHLIICMIYFILKSDHHELVSIHRSIFGKYIGAILSIFVVFYFLVAATVILRGYVRIVQVWIFPDLPTWSLTITLLIIVYYAIQQGFRVVVGVCFFGTVLPFFFFLLAFSTLEFATYRNLLPLFDTTIKEQLSAIKIMVFGFTSLTFLFVFYPFIQHPKKSRKYALLANAVTTIIYLFAAFFTFIFFSEGLLQTTVYPILSTWQILKLPFLERFEYVGIATWMIVILPNITMGIWAASRLLKQQLKVSQRVTLPIILIAALIISILIETRQRLIIFSEFLAQLSLYFDLIYVPLLFIIVLIKRGVKR